MNIYNELAKIEELRQRIKTNQDEILDIYDPSNKKMTMLLKEMNSLLAEADQVEKEMEQLMQQP